MRRLPLFQPSLSYTIAGVTKATLLSLVLSHSSQATANPDNTNEQAYTAEAQRWINRFSSQLKPKLKHALQNGGPVEAISVCAEEAPTIAQQLSQESGWQLKRISLKPRNITNAQPDQWEYQQLKIFEDLLKADTDPKLLQASELSPTHFRFIKAQTVEPLCLICHGETLATEVRKQLNKTYPQDKATGYKLGDIRGAFSATLTLTP